MTSALYSISLVNSLFFAGFLSWLSRLDHLSPIYSPIAIEADLGQEAMAEAIHFTFFGVDASKLDQPIPFHPQT